MKMMRYVILSSLAAGGIAVTVEGAIIGIWRVWFSDEAPLFLRLLVPAMILGMGVAIGVFALNSRRFSDSSSAIVATSYREHAGLR